MKSLVCSDLHDHVNNFESALAVAVNAQCDSVICCGDLCAPFMLDCYNRNCDLPFHVVFGNNDGDRFNMAQKAALINKDRHPGKLLHLHGEFLLAQSEHKLSGIPPVVSIAVYHYPEMAAMVAATGKFNVVFYGHSHRASIEKINLTLLVNPGSVMGFIPGAAAEKVNPTCVIMNWLTGELEIIEL